MNTTPHNRLDPSSFDPEQLEALNKALARPGHVALIDEEGQRTELPAHLFKHLVRIVRFMSEQRAVVLLPEDETFTTQAAANFLGMSRQYFVGIVERGEISHHRVGSHRRVYFKDLIDYQQKRDAKRSEELDALREEISTAGLYFPDPDNADASRL